MKRYFLIKIAFLVVQLSNSQEKIPFDKNPGIKSDYSYSNVTHSLSLGPAFYWTKKTGNEMEYWHAIYAEAGFTWSEHAKSSLVISEGYFTGNFPGFSFGVSSQQYFNILTKHNTYATDVRLSGEIVFAFFGFLGYRYQHPLLKNNEAQDNSRHAFFIRVPIILFSKKRKTKNLSENAGSF